MPGGQRHDRGLQPGPKPGGADPGRQPGARPAAATPTAQLVRAMLSPGHADRRQLGELVTTEPTAPRALLGGEQGSAAAARIGVVIDDLIDLILRAQLTTRTRVAGLPAARLR